MSLPEGAPSVHPVTEQLYNLLPEVYRVADIDPGGTMDFPLLRYLSLIGDLLGEVFDLVDRIDVVREVGDDGLPFEHSDLVDATVADASWLQWLGQMSGVQITGLESVADQRDAVVHADTGWRAGTKQALITAAQRVLGGTQFVEVFDHANAAGPGHGGMWDVMVRTRATETLSDAALLASIAKAGAKPAGVRLWLGRTSLPWDSWETLFATWDDIEAAGSWDAIESTGAVGSSEDLGYGEGAYGTGTYGR